MSSIFEFFERSPMVAIAVFAFAALTIIALSVQIPKIDSIKAHVIVIIILSAGFLLGIFVMIAKDILNEQR